MGGLTVGGKGGEGQVLPGTSTTQSAKSGTAQQPPQPATATQSATTTQTAPPPPAQTLPTQTAGGEAATSGISMVGQPQTQQPSITNTQQPPVGAPTNGQLPLSWPTTNQNYLPYDPRSYGNLDMFTEKVQDAVYDQQMRNLNPTFDRQYRRQKQDLANRGIPVGSEAWKSATEELNRNQANAYQQAANAAIAAGGSEASRLMGAEQQLRGTAFGEATSLNQLRNAQAMDRMNIEMQLRDRALQERLLQRTQAFNEASALLQGAPALTMPQTPQMPTYRLQAPDVIGAHNQAFQNNMARYNAQQQQSAGAWQGIGQLANAGVGLATKTPCAREFKEDFGPAERILDRMAQCEVGTWRYKREIEPEQPMHISPFAEDVHESLGIGDGKTIPFIDLIGVCWKSIQELKDDVDKLKVESKRIAK